MLTALTSHERSNFINLLRVLLFFMGFTATFIIFILGYGIVSSYTSPLQSDFRRSFSDEVQVATSIILIMMPFYIPIYFTQGAIVATIEFGIKRHWLQAVAYFGLACIYAEISPPIARAGSIAAFTFAILRIIYAFRNLNWIHEALIGSIAAFLIAIITGRWAIESAPIIVLVVGVSGTIRLVRS